MTKLGLAFAVGCTVHAVVASVEYFRREVRERCCIPHQSDMLMFKLHYFDLLPLTGLVRQSVRLLVRLFPL